MSLERQSSMSYTLVPLKLSRFVVSGLIMTVGPLKNDKKRWKVFKFHSACVVFGKPWSHVNTLPQIWFLPLGTGV